MDVNLQVVTAAQDVFAEKILRAGLLQRPVQELCAIGHFTADVDVGQMHVVRETGDDHAFDELVRVLVDDLAVLECARLGFVGVANQVNRLAALAVHKRPLQPARKTRAAAPAQAGGHDFLADLFLRRFRFAVGQDPWLDGQRLFERFVAAMAQIAFDVRRVTRLIGVLQNEAVFLRISIQPVSRTSDGDDCQLARLKPWATSVSPGLGLRLDWPGKPFSLSTLRLARWCNGSTADSGSVCHGSNPCRAANLPRLKAEG